METVFVVVNLQATAFAADLSSPRCFDGKMLERFADAIVALEIRHANFACLQAWIFESDACCPYRNLCSIPGWPLAI